MAKKSKLNLINDDLTWNADRRYKVNSVVQLNGEDYQNITGKNSNPELLIDWQKIYTDIAISDVTGLPMALDDLQLNKEDKANKNIANGYAGLDSSGKIIPTQLPALAITETFVVASQAEQLALVAEVGDVAVRTDLNKSFILRVTGASTLANWQELLSPTSVDQTIIDGSTNAVAGNAVFDALATKAPISSVHNQVTLGTANGLSLSTQQLSLGLASSGVTGALSGTDWNTFNGKFNTPTGLTTNYLPKWNGSGLGDSQIFDDGTNTGIGTPTPEAKLDVNGSIFSRSGSILSNSFGGYSGGDVIITTNTSGTASLLFKTASLDRMILKSRGALLINKTDDDLTNQLQVAGTISASPATTANQVPTWGQVQAAARPYKVYTALLTQTGTNAPIATVLENTLGGTVIWSRVSTGTYVGTLAGVFAVNKTICFHQRSSDLTSSSAFDYSMSSAQASTNTVDLKSTLAGGLADGLIIRSSVEIRVYN